MGLTLIAAGLSNSSTYISNAPGPRVERMENSGVHRSEHRTTRPHQSTSQHAHTLIPPRHAFCFLQALHGGVRGEQRALCATGTPDTKIPRVPHKKCTTTKNTLAQECRQWWVYLRTIVPCTTTSIQAYYGITT